MRRFMALVSASAVLAGLLLVPMASGVAAVDTVYPNGGWTCYAHGTIAGGPSTTKSAVQLNLTNPSQSRLGCVWNNSAIPTSFGGACRFENALFVADFRRRLLINAFGTVSLACLDAVITNKTDISITKTDGTTSAVVGTTTTYTITVKNNGPLPGNAVVTDTFPAAITSDTYTSVAAGGATGNTAAGSGAINDTVNLPVAATVTYTVVASISGSATGNLTNTATVAAGAGTIDTNPANNSATDTDTFTRLISVSYTPTGDPNFCNVVVHLRSYAANMTYAGNYHHFATSNPSFFTDYPFSITTDVNGSADYSPFSILMPDRSAYATVDGLSSSTAVVAC